MRSARSNTITECPARLSCWATASPAGPEPTTATFLPVRTAGMSEHGWVHPDMPAVLERVVDDRDLDGLDGDRVIVDAEHARALARRRAEPPRELREVVGRVQPLDGVPPAVLVDEVVPVRDQVAERAALVAEGDAAVHAARALLAEVLDRKRKVDLFPVAQPLGDRPRRKLLALDLQEAGGLTHSWPRPARRTSARAPRRAPCSPPPARA